MEQTTEDRELEYELTIDASGYCLTDRVQQIAEAAAASALKGYENGEHGDLLLNSARAGLIAATAALRALEEAGHLLPEGETVQRWVVMSRDDRPLTLPLDADQLREHMTGIGLSPTDRVDTIRTTVSTIRRKDTRPQAASQPNCAAEAEF